MADTPSPGIPSKRRSSRRILVFAASALVVVLALLGIWLASPVDVDDPVQGTVRTAGVVEIRRGGGSATTVRNLGAIAPGDVLRVPEGSEAAIFLQGGVIGLAQGPAEIAVVESRRQIRAPSVVQALLGQRMDVGPVGNTRISTRVALEVRAGSLAVRTGNARTDSQVAVYAPTLYGRLEGAAAQVTVGPGGGVWWDTLEGTPTLGILSGPLGDQVAVVLPEAPPGNRVLVASDAVNIEATDRYSRLRSSVTAMVDGLRRGEAATEAGGVKYTQHTDSLGLSYLSSAEETPTAEARAPVVESIEPAAIEDLFAVPGVEVRLISDAEVQAALPPGATVHFLPGGSVELKMGGVSSVVRVSVVGGRLQLEGLPLGIDPSAYLSNLPALLTVETDEGVARVMFLPEEPPPTRRESDAGRYVEEGALPHSTSYFVSIPTPLQVSLDWDVAASNFVFIAVLTLLLRVALATTGNILGAQESTLKRFFNPALKLWGRVLAVLLPAVRKAPFAVGLIAGTPIFLMLVNAVVFAFLDARFRPWEGRGFQILPTILLGGVFAGMVDPLVRTRILRKWKIEHHFGFNAGNFLLAIISVSFSRVIRLSPGLMLGGTGGLKASLQDLPQSKKNYLVIVGLVATLVVGVTAWLVTLLLPLAADSPLSAGFVQMFRGPIGTFQDICLAWFAASLTKTFFTLLPVAYSPGITLARSYPAPWLVSFGVIGFIFFHLFINKNTGFTKLLQERGALLVTLVALAFAVALALYVLSRWKAKKAVVQKP